MWRAALVPLLLTVVAAGPAALQTPPDDYSSTVIVVAFDGWRWDYHTKAPTPNLRSLMARGIRAENLIPVFPSKTFPNFYTIATGLFPEHHGIVGNNIKDPPTGRTFALNKRNEIRDAMWWGGEPIWVAAERARRQTAPMFWPGSEAAIGGVRPRHWLPYDEEYPGPARVDRLLQWLDLPDGDRPALLSVYFEDADTAGHDDGPDSPAVREAIRRCDAYLGRLLRGLEQRGLRDRVNIIVLSDHGMAATSSRRVVFLDDYISLADVDVVDINPTLGLFPKPGKQDAVYRALARAHPRLHVYLRDTTPASWHYREHPRIPPIVGVVDEGWQVMRRSSLRDAAGRLQQSAGQHGYDPALLSMRGLFVAAGPAFRAPATVPPFANVHIYNVLARIMNIQPAPNDGDPAIARALLRP